MNGNKHNKHCEAIAKELQAIADGLCVLVDGEIVEVEEDDNGKEYAETGWNEETKIYHTEDGETITINGKQFETEVSDMDTASMWDYFNDFLDVDWIVNSNKEYKACRIMIAWGGPNIYVNTWDGCIELYWWTESGKAWLSKEVCETIDEAMEEIYYC